MSKFTEFWEDVLYGKEEETAAPAPKPQEQAYYDLINETLTSSAAEREELKPYLYSSMGLRRTGGGYTPEQEAKRMCPAEMSVIKILPYVEPSEISSMSP